MEIEEDLCLILNRSKFSQCMINMMKNGVEAMTERRSDGAGFPPGRTYRH
jgi:nitrogen-specific signal transduction histidine kinase